MPHLIYISFFRMEMHACSRAVGTVCVCVCVYLMSQFVLPQGTLCSRLALVSQSSSLSRKRHASVSVPAEIQLKKGAPVRTLPPHSKSLKTYLHHLQLLRWHLLFQIAVPPRWALHFPLAPLRLSTVRQWCPVLPQTAWPMWM